MGKSNCRGQGEVETFFLLMYTKLKTGQLDLRFRFICCISSFHLTTTFFGLFYACENFSLPINYSLHHLPLQSAACMVPPYFLTYRLSIIVPLLDCKLFWGRHAILKWLAECLHIWTYYLMLHFHFSDCLCQASLLTGLTLEVRKFLVFWQSVPLLLGLLKQQPVCFFLLLFINAAERWCPLLSYGLST